MSRQLHRQRIRLATGMALAMLGGLFALPAAARAGCGEYPMLAKMSAAMEDGTTRTCLDPDVGERVLALRRKLGVSSFGMNQIVLEPGQRSRIHRHHRQDLSRS